MTPRGQVAITLPAPGGLLPPRRVVYAIVRATGWRGRLGYLARLKRAWSPRVLLCDYDQAEPPSLAFLRSRLDALGLRVNRRAGGVEYHKTPNGWHVIIHVRQPLELIEAVAAQAILGSDPFREAFGFGRARRTRSRFWRARANLLYDRAFTGAERGSDAEGRKTGTPSDARPGARGGRQ